MIQCFQVTEKEDLIITCKSGITIRTGIQQIREAGRATQGVKLIKLDEGDEIAAISQIEEQEEPVTNLEITEVMDGAEVATDEATSKNEDSQLDNENNQTTNQENPPQPS